MQPRRVQCGVRRIWCPACGGSFPSRDCKESGFLTVVQITLDTCQDHSQNSPAFLTSVQKPTETDMAKFDLAGRKALVTGGARGLGEGMAQALAAAGASVMIGDVLSSLGSDVAGNLSAGGAKAGFVKLDVTKDEDWQAAVKAT